jgi:SAM-dependent methyltransferase
MWSLPKTYFPLHNENRMACEGDVESARERFLKDRPTNLEFLLRQRYEWMNNYLSNGSNIVELGSGPGFSQLFIRNRNFKMSDVVKRPWVQLTVDALDLPFEDQSMDAIVCSHMIHHLTSPKTFFEKATKTLRPGGLIVISEIYTSWLMRFLLRIMRHEGWSYEVNVFDKNAVANDPKDPWSANCAIPQLLFDDSNQFESQLPDLKIIYKERVEGFIFPLSGGIIAKTKTILLPFWALNLVHKFDELLIKISPRVFALGIRIVLQKK